MGLLDAFSSSSSSTATDSRVAATDKAKVAQGKGKILSKGASDLSGSKINTGVSNTGKLNTGTIKTTNKSTKNTNAIAGNKGNVIVGDPNAADKVSSTATSLSDSFLKALGDQQSANNATLVTTLTNVTANKNDSGAADSLTSKFLDTLQAFKPADNGGSAPTFAQVPVPGSTGTTSGADLSSFVNGTLDNSFASLPDNSGGAAGSAKKPWLWILGSVVLVGLAFWLLKKMRK